VSEKGGAATLVARSIALAIYNYFFTTSGQYMDQKRLDRQMTATRWIFIGVVGLVTIAYAGMGYMTFGWEKFSDPATWGQVGDYFGGLLNPIVGACTLYWLLVSVRIQRTELAETRSALEKTQLAAEEQVKLALLSSQIESLNIRAAFISDELSHVRASRLYYVQCANREHGTISKVISENGKYEDPLLLIKTDTERIKELNEVRMVLAERLTALVGTTNVS